MGENCSFSDKAFKCKCLLCYFGYKIAGDNMANLISLDKIDEMYDAYLDKQSVSFVMKKCSVSKGTARKYISVGDPNRGIDSFKTRYLDVSAAKNKTSEKKFEDKADVYRKENFALLRKFKGMLAKALNDMKEFDVSTLTPMKVAMILEMIPKVEAFLLGQATEVVQHNHVHTSTLGLPPDRMALIAKIVLEHRQEQADITATRQRQLAENKIAVSEGRFEDVVEVIDAEYTVTQEIP